MSTTAATAAPPRPPERLVSLDQFRGYTVVGMLLVNFLASYAACPRVLRHTHDYVSYADTIMPQFLFAVGFSLRLTFGRRAQEQGLWLAYGRMVRRLLGLALISVVVYTASPRGSWNDMVSKSLWDLICEPLKRSWFQTLMHIAATSLWILPVIRAGAGIRFLWMIGSAALHVYLSYRFNFVWVNSAPNGIDGGPLGFLTWTIPAIVGTFACDVMTPSPSGRGIAGLIAGSIVLMGLGYVFSCGTRFYDVPESQVEEMKSVKLAADPVFPPREQIESHFREGSVSTLLAEPPFVPPPDAAHRKWNYWMMSQRAGTLSYLTFSAGFSLAVYLLFVLACDVGGWQLAFFRTFGTNALLAYVLHDLVSAAVKPFAPKDAPGWYVVCALMAFFAICWMIVRHFEKRGMYLRV